MYFYNKKFPPKALSLLISTILFSHFSLATDWIIDDNQPDMQQKFLENTTWDGNVQLGENVKAETTLEMSTWNGNLGETTVNSPNKEFTVNIRNQSQWNGDVQLSSTQTSVNVYYNSQWTGNASLSNESFGTFAYEDSIMRANINLTGTDGTTPIRSTNSVEMNSKWYGDSKISSHTGNELSNFTVIADHSLWVGNTQLENSSDLGMSFMQIHVMGESEWLGNAELTSLNNDSLIQITLREGSTWVGNLELNNKLGQGNSEIALNDGSTWTGHVIANNGLQNLNLGGIWNMTGDTTVERLGSMDGGTINFIDSASRTAQYHQLNIAELSGDLNLTMRAGFFGVNNYGSDKLIITQAKQANDTVNNHQIILVNNGSDNTHGTESITLVETADGHDQFDLMNDVELGGYVYTLEKAGNNWELRSGQKGSGWQPQLSNPADAAANNLNIGYLINYAEAQTLLQRMGDLRQNQASANVWTRGYTGGFNAFSGGSLKGFDMHYNGFQIGADKQLTAGDSQVYVGLLYGVTNASQDYTTGSGSTRNQHFGLYSSYMLPSGLYIDGLIKYNRMKNDYNVADTAGQSISGEASSNGFSASLETGKRFHLNTTSNGLYLEPQTQLTVSQQGSAHFAASNGLQVNLDRYTTVLGRAGMLLGYEMKAGNTPANFYVKTNYIHEFKGKTYFSLNDSTQSHSFKGDWWVNGVGASAQINKRHNIYLDMEQASGKRFKQHQLNAGYRFNF